MRMKFINYLVFIKSQSYRFFKFVFALLSGLVGTAFFNLFDIIKSNNDVIRNISHAFFIASLFFTLVKIFVCTFSPLLNFILLLTLTFYAYNNHYYIQFQYLFVLIIRKIMPKHFFVPRNETITNLIAEWKEFPEEQTKWKNLEKITFSELISLNVYCFFIFVRLLFLEWPIVSGFFYFLFFFFLIFNKLVVFMPLVSLIILISRLCFFILPLTYTEMKEKLQLYSDSDLNDVNNYIKINKKNVIIISYFLLSCLEKKKYERLLIHKTIGILHEQFFVVLLQEKKTSLFMTLGRPRLDTGKLSPFKLQ